MKKNVYLNIDLDIFSMNNIISSFINASYSDVNYIKLKRLDKKEEIDKLMNILSENDVLYIFDYKSLDLTLTEFKTLHFRLLEKNIEVIFINESENYYNWLVDLTLIDFDIRSARVVDAIKLRRQKGVVLGRPKVNTDIQNKITYLYREQKKTMREIAQICDVSLGTVYKYVHHIKNVKEG